MTSILHRNLTLEHNNSPILLRQVIQLDRGTIYHDYEAAAYFTNTKMQASQTQGIQTVKSHLTALALDLKQNNLQNGERERLLSELKALGRDVNNVKGVYDGTTVDLLTSYGLGSFPSAIKREAFRCLANGLILVPSMQDALASSGRLPGIADYYGTPEDDDEFLGARIMFFMTYNANAGMPQIIQDQNVSAKVVQQLERHRDIGGPLVGQGITSMALSETMKLLFNIVNFVPSTVDQLTAAVPILYAMLQSAKIPSPPLQPPLTYVLNALGSIDAGKDEDYAHAAAKYLPDAAVLEKSVEKLIAILDRSLSQYTSSQLDTQLISVLTILRRINALAGPVMKAKLQQTLLPKDSERDVPLGQSSTLASRLLKLITAPGLVHLSEAVSSLLFELSGSDAHKFVQNVGYGYAAGYLMTHKIPIPEGAKQPSRADVPVNPVTGQRLDKEPDTPLPDMTQEEKEREAERLFVLFERLKATGVVDVKNPVEQARDEGRLREVSDSELD